MVGIRIVARGWAFKAPALAPLLLACTGVSFSPGTGHPSGAAGTEAAAGAGTAGVLNEPGGSVNAEAGSPNATGGTRSTGGRSTGGFEASTGGATGEFLAGSAGLLEQSGSGGSFSGGSGGGSSVLTEAGAAGASACEVPGVGVCDAEPPVDGSACRYWWERCVYPDTQCVCHPNVGPNWSCGGSGTCPSEPTPGEMCPSSAGQTVPCTYQSGLRCGCLQADDGYRWSCETASVRTPEVPSEQCISALAGACQAEGDGCDEMGGTIATVQGCRCVCQFDGAVSHWRCELP